MDLNSALLVMSYLLVDFAYGGGDVADSAEASDECFAMQIASLRQNVRLFLDVCWLRGAVLNDF